MANLSRRESLVALGTLALAACGKQVGAHNVFDAQHDIIPQAVATGSSGKGVLRLFAASEDAALYVVTTTGELVWYKDASVTPAGQHGSGIFNFAFGGTGQAINSGFSTITRFAYGGSGMLYAVDSSGALHWYKDLARNGTASWDAASGSTIASGWASYVAICGDYDGVLYALDSSGNLRWFRDLARNGTSNFAANSGAIIATGVNAVSMFCAGNGRIYVVTQAGEIRWYDDLARDGSVNLAANSGAVLLTGLTNTTKIAGDSAGTVYVANSALPLGRAKDLSQNGTPNWDISASATKFEPLYLGWDMSSTLYGYASPISVGPGETVSIMTSPGRALQQYRLTIYRLKPAGTSVGTAMTASVMLSGVWQSIPQTPWSTDFHWLRTFTQSIPGGWPTGLYSAHCEFNSGSTYDVAFAVVARKQKNPIAVVASVNTWNSYNNWGGRSNYTAPNATPLTFNRPSFRTNPIATSFNRELAGELYLPGWLEDNGYAYDLITDIELDAGTPPLSRYAALLLNVHPEYFTLNARTNVQNYLSAGGSLIYLGGNGIYERVDYTPDRTATILRQGVATNPRWLFRFQGMSEAQILGVAYTRATSTTAPYVVVDDTSPLMTQAGLHTNDAIGSAGIYGAGSGNECDTITADSPPQTKMIAHGSNSDGSGANMVRFETGNGGFVFSASSTYFTQTIPVDAHSQAVLSSALNDALSRAPRHRGH